MRDTYIPISPFIETFCQTDESKPMLLDPWLKEILAFAFTPDKRGKLQYKTVVISSPKKTAKTSLGAAIDLWFAVCMSQDDGEIYVVANARQHAKERAFTKIQRMVQKCPELKAMTTAIQAEKIIFQNGTVIQAISSDAGSVAGANPEVVHQDELWSASAASQERLYEELTPVRTRHNSFRLITSYAGFENYSKVLERVYAIAMKGEPVLPHIEFQGDPVCRVNKEAAMFTYWDRAVRPSWCQEGLEEYLREQRATLTRMAFMRLHENQWVSSNEGIDPEDWDACIAEYEELLRMEAVNPPPPDPNPERKKRIVLGVDASYSGDRTAVVAITKKDGRMFYMPEASRTWQPTKTEIMDPKKTAGDFIIALKQKYRIAACYYDPAHFVSVAMWLSRKGVRMHKVAPTESSVCAMGNGLIEALRFRKLMMPYNKMLRDEAMSVSLKLTNLGAKIEKGRHSAKVDSITALSLAIMAADRLPDVGDAVSQIVFFGDNQYEART